MVTQTPDPYVVKENPKGHPKNFKLTIGMRILLQAAFMAFVGVVYCLYCVLMPEFWLPMNIEIQHIIQTKTGHNVPSMMKVHKASISEAFGNLHNKDLDSVCLEVAIKAA